MVAFSFCTELPKSSAVIAGLWFATLFAGLIQSNTFPVFPIKEAMSFLEKYSYLEAEDPSPTQKSKTNRKLDILPMEQLSKALLEFQRFAGIAQTGVLDGATMAMMRAPRCGVADVFHDEDSDTHRRKRYAHLDHTWNKTALTYKISRFPSRVNDREAVRREIVEAFEVWSAVTPLTFEEKQQGGVDIEIRFAKGAHGDGRRNSFDGPGMVVAHAFPPENGDTHFDDEEVWTFEGEIGKGANLFQTAVHEFGHSLGLDHTELQNAIMYPYYRGYKLSYSLHRDDIEGIQAHYGGPYVPDLCNDSSIDTVTRTEDGSTYVFKGIFYWKILSIGGFAKGYPRRISNDWDGLPENLDASVYWPDGKTFFFKEEWYWKFTNKVAEPGFPKLIRNGFPGMPDSPDAAFVWSGNGLTYFFKGSNYWRLHKGTTRGKYSQPISSLRGVPNDIDAAFQSETGLTYIFKDNGYYLLGSQRLEIDNEDESQYPVSTAQKWFSC